MVDALNKLADVIVQELLDLPVILVGVCFGETLGDKNDEHAISRRTLSCC